MSQIATLAMPDDPYFVPVLQTQNGWFVGYVDGGNHFDMVAFDGSGSVRWIVPNESPLIATADGGVIGESGTTYDQSGGATGKSMLTASTSPGWLGNVLGTVYSAQSEEVVSIAGPNTNYASTFSAFPCGNASGNCTAIQQVMAKSQKTGVEQLPNLSSPVCYPLPVGFPSSLPTCGNINAIELLTPQSPDFIFQNFIQTFAPVRPGNNAVMEFRAPNDSLPNVTGSGQVLKINIKGWSGRGLGLIGENPFYVLTERFDPVDHVISVVTLTGHPLAGWRYWRVYSIGPNDVVVETGAYDQPGPGLPNYVGYYTSKAILQEGWKEYMYYIRTQLGSPAQGQHLQNALGGIQLRSSPPQRGLLAGYWDYFGDFTNYILNNVCLSTGCN